jgi:hypothetical protein
LLPINLKHNSLKKSRSPTDKITNKKTVYQNLEIRQHYQENLSTKCKENTTSLNGRLTTKRAPQEINKKTKLIHKSDTKSPNQYSKPKMAIT